MRSTLIRLATPSKYLTPGNPTGLTGLLTHPSPRAELILLYTATLSKLAKFPEYSSYRNATEALTKSRLAHVESIKPAGWDEWKVKSDALIKEHPNIFRVQSNKKRYIRRDVDGKAFIVEKLVVDENLDDLEFQGQKLPSFKEGPGGKSALIALAEKSQKIAEYEVGEEKWIVEPKLDAEQVSQLEDKIGAGLIEEVISVAKGELDLVDTMFHNNVWEELQDKPAPGQWEYFARDRNVGETQEPPKA